VIVITGRRDVPLAVRAMRAGAVDFLQKPFDDQALLGAIDRALARRTQSADRADALRRLERLTPRERDVLRLIVAGRANKEVAAQLAISPRTAENHRSRIMEKTDASSLAALVRLAMAAGIEIRPLSPPD
jgi:two-component system response regulator FixJ